MGRNSLFSFGEVEESALAYSAFQQASGQDNSLQKEKLEYLADYIIENFLTLRERTALVLYYREKINLVKIAELTGRNKSSISRNLSRGRAKLQKYLSLAVYSDKIGKKLANRQ
jgi:RNA polymerase sigma factor (sigma-70 family)